MSGRDSWIRRVRDDAPADHQAETLGPGGARSNGGDGSSADGTATTGPRRLARCGGSAACPWIWVCSLPPHPRPGLKRTSAVLLPRRLPVYLVAGIVACMPCHLLPRTLQARLVACQPFRRPPRRCWPRSREFVTTLRRFVRRSPSALRLEISCVIESRFSGAMILAFYFGPSYHN